MPTRMVTTPSTMLISRMYSHSQSPSAPDRVPSATKTNEKPSTNSALPSTIRPRRADARSAPDSPVA